MANKTKLNGGIGLPAGAIHQMFNEAVAPIHKDVRIMRAVLAVVMLVVSMSSAGACEKHQIEAIHVAIGEWLESCLEEGGVAFSSEEGWEQVFDEYIYPGDSIEEIAEIMYLAGLMDATVTHKGASTSCVNVLKTYSHE